MCRFLDAIPALKENNVRAVKSPGVVLQEFLISPLQGRSPRNQATGLYFLFYKTE